MASRRTRRAPSTTTGRAGGTAAAGSRRAALAAEQERKRQAKRTNTIITVAVAAVLAVVVGVAAVVLLRPEATPAAGETPAGSTTGSTVRADSHRLSNPPNSTVTFVEFLDFECEACGAAFPAVEQLRQTFGDRVTFVARYFPLDGHFNAKRAARAVEAAAQQGKFEQMYQKMYHTQTAWAEQQVSKDDLFRQYAAELGLDLARWDTDYNSQATLDRIQVDIDDGTKLGVAGTPSFFVNGQRIEPKSIDDLTETLEQALAAAR